jgi:TPR repeat protein
MRTSKKIFINILQKLHTILILLYAITPAYSSLEVGETLMNNGKFDEAISTLSPFAAQENPKALYLLAGIYLSKNSPHLNYQMGRKLLERAVALNYPPAMDELAGLYLTGEGVEKNEAKALQYYIQASYKGYGPSQFNCGIMYKEGRGTEKDYTKAYFYLCLASLNFRDLDSLTEDAARYRDELVPFLNPDQRQRALSEVNALTLPENSF